MAASKMIATIRLATMSLATPNPGPSSKNPSPRPRSSSTPPPSSNHQPCAGLPFQLVQMKQPCRYKMVYQYEMASRLCQRPGAEPVESSLNEGVSSADSRWVSPDLAAGGLLGDCDDLQASPPTPSQGTAPKNPPSRRRQVAGGDGFSDRDSKGRRAQPNMTDPGRVMTAQRGSTAQPRENQILHRRRQAPRPKYYGAALQMAAATMTRRSATKHQRVFCEKEGNRPKSDARQRGATEAA